MLPNSYFVKKRQRLLLFVLLLLAVTLGSIILTEYDVVQGFSSIPKAIAWGLSNFYPTAKALTRLPNILVKLKETILVSIAATTVGACLALVFAILGSSTTQINGVMGWISRGIATVFRNIDVAVWAMILLFSFGQSVLTGCLALFFGSFGFLTRAFISTIDEASGSSVEALQATGAGYLPIIFQAVIPASLPQMISWVLFTVETNIRQATLVGVLTGSGIGFAFNLYYKSLNYNAASLVVIVIVIAVLLIESLSNYVRKVIL
jgi:phosphonate ABC transporter permease subunit PhnE